MTAEIVIMNKRGVAASADSAATVGKKTFNGHCTRCDCIFEYEIEDIDGSDMVKCPDCGHKNLHILNQPV